MSDFWMVDSWATSLLSLLCRASWQGAIALGLAWVLTRGGWLPARYRCWVWRLAYAKLLLALFWVQPVELPVLPPPAPLERADSTLQVPIVTVEDGSWVPLAQGDRPLESATPRLWAVLLGGAWMMGAAIVILRAARAWRQARRCRRESSPITDGELQRECAQLSDAFGLSRAPALAATRERGGPRLSGLVRPLILLPERWMILSASTRLLLAHELAHLRRRDLWWNWLELVVRALFFFHPLIWVAQREWFMSQELACDERVLSVTGSPASEYRRLLIQVASGEPSAAGAGMSAGIVDSKTSLRERLIKMKIQSSLSFRARMLLAFPTLLLASAAVVPWRLVAQAPDSPAAPAIRGDAPGPDEVLDSHVTQEAPGVGSVTAAGAPPAPSGAQTATPKPSSAAHQAELLALRAELEVARARLELAEENYARLRDLSRQDLVPQAEVDTARSAVLESRAQLARGEAHLIAAETQPLEDSKDRQIKELQQTIRALQQQLAAETALKAAREAQTPEIGTSREPQRPDQRELLQEEIKLAEQHLQTVIRAYQGGTADMHSVLEVRGELLDLHRQLAAGDVTHLREVLEQERHVVKAHLKEVQKLVEIGRLPASADLLVRRRLLALDRELLALGER